MILAMAIAMPTAPISEPPTVPRMCRGVRGRMSAANGDPALRIWEIGTRHYLGVDVGQDLSLSTMPRNLRDLWIRRTRGGSLFDASVYGDFRVCAAKPRRAGEMEIVRVTAARRLTVRLDR
jgi:hypothetical protein